MSADLRSLCLNPVCIPPPPSEHLSTGQRCSRGRSRLRIPVLYPATSSATCSLANSFKWPQIRSCNLKYYDTVQRMSDLAQFYLITSLYYRIETSQYTLSVCSCLIEKNKHYRRGKIRSRYLHCYVHLRPSHLTYPPVQHRG